MPFFKRWAAPIRYTISPHIFFLIENEKNNVKIARTDNIIKSFKAPFSLVNLPISVHIGSRLKLYSPKE